MSSKILVETMQRLLPEKSISLMVYLHANNRNLLIEVDREVVESISKFVEFLFKNKKAKISFQFLRIVSKHLVQLNGVYE